MQLLDLTLPTPAENLALDEALLDAAETGQTGEILRFWEAPRPLVVLGRSSVAAAEVDLDRCQSLGIPVLRRASGGAAIVAGPGCLMYGVVLSYQRQPALRMLDQAHEFVLSRIALALRRLGHDVSRQGTSDLALAGRKFSGNSLRCKRDHLLYHGTLLYDFPLDLIGQLLRTAPRQPAYRAGREHGDFVVNLPVVEQQLRQVIANSFEAWQVASSWPANQAASLVAERYSQSAWNMIR
ncbi:MAG: lipoate--protein ligase family protein [Pirellulaceae bacterium]|nr:lipoate--protein ligase family protein [Pirellulaceae bacterium]